MQTYYKMSYVDRQITNPEHRLCEDIPRFCDAVGGLLREVINAAVDAIVFSALLRSYSRSHKYTLAILGYVVSSASARRVVQTILCAVLCCVPSLGLPWRVLGQEPVCSVVAACATTECLHLTLKLTKAVCVQLSAGVLTVTFQPNFSGMNRRQQELEGMPAFLAARHISLCLLHLCACQLWDGCDRWAGHARLPAPHAECSPVRAQRSIMTALIMLQRLEGACS